MKQVLSLIKGPLIFLCIAFLLNANSSFAQDSKMDVGLQIRPIFKNQFFNSGNTAFEQGNIIYEIVPELGYSYGMVVRTGLTKKLSLETGINYVRRNYLFTLEDQDSAVSISSAFGVIEYEIPISVLVYIRLSDKIYMNTSSGLSLNMFKKSVIEPKDNLIYIFQRSTWIIPGLIANMGWEYRTSLLGSFYLGASYQFPFSKVITMHADYYKNIGVESMSTKVGLAFITFDFKYFFPEKSK